MRRLMWFTLGFGIACAVCAYFYTSWLWLAAVAATILCVLSVVGTLKWRNFRIAVVLFAGMAVGFGYFSVYDGTLLENARTLNGKTEYTTVYVRDYSYASEYGSVVDGAVMVNGQMYHVRVYLTETENVEPGDRLVGTFKFRITTGSADDVLYHRGNGRFLLATQKGNAVVERCHSVPWICYPAVWRHSLENRLTEAFSEDTVGFAKALFLGDRSEIDYETNTALKISGISHIIAVSGLHVSILFGLVYFISGKRRFLTTLIGIPTVLLFAAVVGFTPSVTRAALMQIVMMLSLLLSKEYDRLTALSFAGLVMLVINPLVISSVSFQLSFACMAGITLLGEPISNWLKDKKRLGKWKGKISAWLISGVSVSVSATVFTTPLVALYFGCISLVAVLTNLLTVWCITWIFYGILLVCVASLFHGGVATGIAWTVGWLIRYVLAVSKCLASFPLAAVYTKSIYIVIWLIMSYILLAVFFGIGKKSVGLFAGTITALLGVCIAMSWIEPLLDDCRMTVLDVGQGQAILLQSEGKTYLVDCGGDYDTAVADNVAETLLSQGVCRLDGIILTHYDRDHSGGLPYLLTRIDTDILLLPHAKDDNGVAKSLKMLLPEQTAVVKQDVLLTFGQAKLQIFAPFSYNSGNESSMSLLFETENCAILITGDMGETGERLLLKYHDLPQVDVLMVGHHGAKTSTSEVLLTALNPGYAFISVGADNTYGHPADEILRRLVAFGCVVYRTDENGVIVFRG